MLREYQTAICAEVAEALKEHTRIVVASPTGSGKTILAAEGIIPLLKRPIAWITHRRELIHQIAAHRLGIDLHMIQSKKIKRHYGSIIIDEGHHGAAMTYKAVFERYPKSTFIGLTATPYRLDGIGLGSVGFTKIIIGPDIHQLTQLGFLSKARTYIPAEETLGAWEPVAAARKIIQTKFSKAIIYARSIDDGLSIAKECTRLGKRTELIDGSTKMQRRDLIIGKFAKGHVDAICNHTIFTEGYDSPSTDLVVLNRLTMSRGLWKQMCGRVLRTAQGKTTATILDLAGNAILHGSIYDLEIYDLDGAVSETVPRDIESDEPIHRDYLYSTEQDIKLWTPPRKPTVIRESLQRLKSRSPLRKLWTA